MDDKAQQLLELVERVEQAAKRGIELNLDRCPSIPAEKAISIEQCEWTLKDCNLFRRAICRIFELPPQSISLGKEAQLSAPLVLTLEQIKELARFAVEDGQPSYTITTGTIPAFEADDGELVEEYNGLIAYSESEEHGVLQLS